MIRAATVEQPLYLTPPEVGRRLGVSADKVLGWIRAGRLRAVNTSDGGQRPRYRIHEADLEVFLNSLAVNAASAQTRRQRANPTEVIEFIR